MDPEARRIEVYRLADDGYRVELAASGGQPLALPPLPDLAFVPASLWP